MTVTAPLSEGLVHFGFDDEVGFLFARVVWGAFTTDEDGSSIDDVAVEVAECTVVDALWSVVAALHAATERTLTPMISNFLIAS